jgi:pimeloyl-ACP methyl ester carboxylesterase
MTLEIQEHAFNVGALTINYAEGPPSGPPLVLLHGGSARWQSFDAIIPDLAAHWHLYAPDFRGHGKSGWVPGSYRLQHYADDTIAFFRQCLQEPAYVFGHSLGGMVALLVAAQCPECVRAVAVGDSPLTGETWHTVLSQGRDRLAAWRALAGGQRTLQELIEILKDVPVEVAGRADSVPMREVMGEDSPVFPWLATNLYQNDPDMLSALLDDFEHTAAGYDMLQVFPAIRCPVLLLQADPASGGLMTDAEVKRAIALLVQPSHVHLANLSHVFHNERKEPVLQALIDFFEVH